jgi:membrane-bound metal-dependent hydrolase YbcI (DUF457 family)
MFAINHAATALVIKKCFPTLPMAALLVSVQLVEMLWVALNLAGIEHLTTEAQVSSVADIHLAHMPYSHSIATSAALALAAWLVLAKLLRRHAAAAAVAIAILSHLVLDLLTHTPDIALAPFAGDARFGLGLYSLPPLAFAAETAYGLLCWRVFRGGRKLLAVILVFNLANLSLFAPGFRGPEALLAREPAWIVAAVAVQIALTLLLVWYTSRGRAAELERPENRLGGALAASRIARPGP